MSSGIHFIGGTKLATQTSIDSNKLKESQENVMKQIVFPIANASLGSTANLTTTPIVMNEAVNSQNIAAPNTVNMNTINLVAITTTVSNSTTVNLLPGSILPANANHLDTSYTSASNVMPSVVASSMMNSNIISGASQLLKTGGPIKRVEHHVSPIQIKPQVINRTVPNAKPTVAAPRIWPLGEGMMKSTIKPCAISTGSTASNTTNSIIPGSSGGIPTTIAQRFVIHSKNSKLVFANKFPPNLRPSVSLSTRPSYTVASNTVLVSPTILPSPNTSSQTSVQTTSLGDNEATSDTTVTISTSDVPDSRSTSPPPSNSTPQVPTPSILTRKRPFEDNAATTAIFALIKQSDSSQNVISRTHTLPKSIATHSESSPSRKRSRKQHLAEIRSEQPTPATIPSTMIVTAPTINNAPLTISTSGSNPVQTNTIVPNASLHTQLSSLCSPISIHPAASSSNISKPTVRLIADSSSISNSNITNDSSGNPTPNFIMYSFVNTNTSGPVAPPSHIIPTILPSDSHIAHHDVYSATTNATILEGAEETVTSSGLSQQEMLEQQGMSKLFHNLPSSGQQHVGEMSLLTPPISNHGDNYSMHFNDSISGRLQKQLSSDEEAGSNQTQYSGFFNYKRLTLSDKCSWDSRPNHYETYLDVRPRREVKQSVNEVFYQKDIRRRTVGWPLSRVVAQYHNLIDVENENLQKLEQLRNGVLPSCNSSRKDDSNKVIELIDNISKQKKFLIDNLKKISGSTDGLIEDNWAIALDIMEKSKSRRPTRRK